MPTMTNPETGETKEISMEEFLAAMRNGQISVRQEVHHADGSVTASTIYGNDIGDGVDRSVNIFAATNDVLSPAVMRARKVKEENPNAEKLFFMDNSGADYEVTVDDTSMPTMHIISCTKDSIKVARYIRDERKTVGTPLDEKTFSFVNGALEASLEDVQGNTMMLFAFGVYEIRKLLTERGILQELQKLANRSSGVVISKSGEEIVTRIVRGRNRPDLPCMMFGGLFSQGIEDAVMMRPYMDEMMGDTLYAGMSVEDKIKAAEDGNPDFMEELAQIYLNGDGVEQNFEKAAYWWEKLANTDNPIGQFNIGLHYAKGCGVKRDFGKAAEWMRLSAENGDVDAPVLLEKYRKAAAAQEKIPSGDAQAQADLAGVLMALAGSLEQAGAGKDYEEAFALAQKSAAQNNGDGFWALALAYEHGRGVRKSVAKAIEYYRQGAELGHAACQHSLACYYMRGDRIQKDETLAFDLMLKAAEQGYGLAMKDVGRCYQFGNGVVENMSAAIEWYEKALMILDDPELEEKVALFKELENSGSFSRESQHDLPDGYMDALQNFIDKDEARARSNIAAAICHLGADFNPETEIAVLTEEVVGTQFEGRNQRVECIRLGDIVNLVREPENQENGLNISVRNRNGESLGNLSAGTCRLLAPIMDENLAKKITAKVCEVVPLSKRGPRAKKSILKLTITLDLQNVIASVVCKLGGDQVNVWVQKLTVGYTTLPTKHAELLFELYNRSSGEYENLDKGENDTSYAGLDNLEEEIRAAREKMSQQRVAALDYSKDSSEEYEAFGAYVQRMIGKDCSRYGALRRYEISEYERLEDILDRFTIGRTHYYWIDQTRTTEEVFDETSGYNHWYEVLELYDGKQMPVDLTDEDVVSIFGCGKFVAFADLSYGC